MKLLFQWAISTIAILIAAYIVPGVSVTPTSALIAAVVLGALNLFIRPILVVLTLPITVITLCFFSLVINALLVMLVKPPDCQNSMTRQKSITGRDAVYSRDVSPDGLAERE